MSDETPELSEGGGPIYRHKPREKPFEPAFGDIQHIQLIEQHIEKHLGEPDFVFHEIISDLVHLDVHIIPPRPERDFYTLVTTGMSARAMKVPEGLEELSYAELLLSLPPDWPLRQEDFENEANYWPVRTLKMLARLPHEYDTWLCEAHTIPNGDPAEPYAPNTKLCCAMLAPPLIVPDEFRELSVTPEMSIHFYGVIPIYQEEMDLKLKKGAEELYDLFDKHEVSELLDVNRKNVAKKRFGLF
jgi:hypothetical protein